MNTSPLKIKILIAMHQSNNQQEKNIYTKCQPKETGKKQWKAMKFF